MHPRDIVARLGGDEFVVAAHCPDGRVAAAALAERILAGLQAPFEIQGREVFITASIGISLFPEDARTKERLFQNADLAMYRAKAAARNNYRFFETEMSAETSMRIAIGHALWQALERQEFQVHYQAQVNLSTGCIVGLEALLRWKHPEFHAVSADRYIRVAEETGLIVPIGAWVLRTACKQAQQWRLTGWGERSQRKTELTAVVLLVAMRF